MTGARAARIAFADRQPPVQRRIATPRHQAAVALARQLRRAGVDVVEIIDHRPHRAREIVEVEPVKAGHGAGIAPFIVGAQPADEGVDVGVAPHPGREALESRLLALALRPMPDIAVDIGRVGPVRLDRDDVEAVPLDQPPRDRRASAVEFGRAVARLAEQDEAGVAEPVEWRGEAGIIDLRQRLGGIAHQCRKRIGHRSRQPCSPISGTKRTAPRFSSIEAVLAGAGDLDQILDRARLADRHHQRAADRELALQRLGDMAAARGGEDRVERRLSGQARRAVALDDPDIVVAEPLHPLRRQARRARRAARSRSPRRRSGRSPPPHSPSRRRSRAPCRPGRSRPPRSSGRRYRAARWSAPASIGSGESS